MTVLRLSTQPSLSDMQAMQEQSMMSSLNPLAISAAALSALAVLSLGFATTLLTGMFAISSPWVYIASFSSSMLVGIAALFYTYYASAGPGLANTDYNENSAASETNPTFATASKTIPSKALEHTNSKGNDASSTSKDLPESTVTDHSAATPAWSIIGLWATKTENHAPRKGLMAIYEHDGMYYGRVLVTYKKNGKVRDTILKQESKAPGISGNPPYCGIDMIYNLKKMNLHDDITQKYRGSLIDPSNGRIYSLEVWRSGVNLTVKAMLWGSSWLSRVITWDMAHPNDLPEGFSLEGIKGFMPSIPLPKQSC